jgi:hypothetical protein
MTIDSKRFTRPLILAAAFAAIFTILPSRVDHGALFGVSAAMAHGRSGGDHGGFGGAGRHGTDIGDHGLGQGAPKNGGPNSDPAASADPRGISQGAPKNGGLNSDPAASSGSRGVGQAAPRNE